MFCYLMITLHLLSASLTFGTEPPPSKHGDVDPSPHYESRIVGGEPVDIEDYPYMAGYHWTSKEGYAGFCGGAIVTDQFVVTAAHCVDEITDPSILKLRVGSSDRTAGTIVPVLDIIIHPDFIEDHSGVRFVNYDVALLKTGRLKFSNKVRPIELPKPNATVPNYITVTGWGTGGLGGRKPLYLMGVELETLNTNWCKTTFYNFIIAGEMFCAGGMSKGICAGDDGTPAVHEGSNSTVLTGIALFQRGCASGLNPAAFIKVSAPPILDFITNTTEIADK